MIIAPFVFLTTISIVVSVYLYKEVKECERRIRFLIKRNKKLVGDFCQLDDIITLSDTIEECLDKRMLNVRWEVQQMKDSIEK